MQCSKLSSHSYAATHLVLHGLWPQYSTARGEGTAEYWPQYCGIDDTTHWNVVGSLLPDVANSFYEDWQKYAPAYAFGGLASHEWAKHGTCYTKELSSAVSNNDVAMLQTLYFQYANNLVRSVGTPSELINSQAAGTSLPLEEIQNLFGGPSKVALSCSVYQGKPYLSQVNVCYEVRNNGAPGPRSVCPTHVIDSTYANSCVTKGVAKIYFSRWGNCPMLAEQGSWSEGPCPAGGGGGGSSSAYLNYYQHSHVAIGLMSLGFFFFLIG